MIELRTETFAPSDAASSFTWEPPPEGARILAVRFNLTTGTHTTPGSYRLPYLSFRYGKVTAAASVFNAFQQIDSQVADYSFFRGATPLHVNIDNGPAEYYCRAELPDIDLGSNWQLLLSITGADPSAADVRGALSLTYMPLR